MEYLSDELREQLSQEKKKYAEKGVSLIAPSFGPEEVEEALKSLISTYVTMGDKVEEFEDRFSDYIGADNGVMVNSGSSANLIALSVMANELPGELFRDNGEIVVPSTTWSTSIFPMYNTGFKPYIVDVDRETLTIDVEQVKEAVTSDTVAIMPVHLMGNPAEMGALRDIAEDHDIKIIEDCCEAHGAEYGGERVGTFGSMGTFSFFFAHHISTMEGGMVVTDSEDHANTARSERAHGWIRERSDRETIEEKHEDIDPRYLFTSHGYNLRPTDIQGGFGLHQLDKLEGFIETRRKNASEMKDALGSHSDVFNFQKEQPGGRSVWFGFPIILREESDFSAREFRSYLEDNDIETRPIVAGDITRHPVFEDLSFKKSENLGNAQRVMDNGVFIGCHPGVTEEKRDYVIETISDFVEG